MSAFRVFGTSLKNIYDLHYKKSEKKKDESIADFDKRIALEAEDIFSKCNAIKPVSEKCDAPCFCRDFIDMADPNLFKNLEVRVNAWSGKIDQKTRQPKFSWVKYEEGKEYRTWP